MNNEYTGEHTCLASQSWEPDLKPIIRKLVADRKQLSEQSERRRRQIAPPRLVKGPRWTRRRRQKNDAIWINFSSKTRLIGALITRVIFCELHLYHTYSGRSTRASFDLDVTMQQRHEHTMLRQASSHSRRSRHRQRCRKGPCLLGMMCACHIGMVLRD